MDGLVQQQDKIAAARDLSLFVTHEDYRRRGIGRLIVESLFNEARHQGCYKMVLQCEEHNVKFYNKMDYFVSGVSMHNYVGNNG